MKENERNIGAFRDVCTLVAPITRLVGVAQRVAANPTKTTAANAAAETRLSEGPPLLVGLADEELEVLEPEAELAPPEAELESPEAELEPPVLVLEEPVAVVVTNPVFVEGPVGEVPVPVGEESVLVVVAISRHNPLAIPREQQLLNRAAKTYQVCSQQTSTC